MRQRPNIDVSRPFYERTVLWEQKKSANAEIVRHARRWIIQEAKFHILSYPTGLFSDEFGIGVGQDTDLQAC